MGWWGSGRPTLIEGCRGPEFYSEAGLGRRLGGTDAGCPMRPGMKATGLVKTKEAEKGVPDPGQPRRTDKHPETRLGSRFPSKGTDDSACSDPGT